MKNITLTAAVSEAVDQKIKSLEIKVRRLEARLLRQNQTISDLKKGAAFSKEKRDSLQRVVETLLQELQDKDWVELDNYYA